VSQTVQVPARATIVVLAVLSLVLSVFVAAPVAARPQQEVEQSPAVAVEPSSSGRYIVVLADAPLAAYGGGVAGLAPTDPLVTGADRLDASSAESRAYLAYLATQQDAALAAIAAAIGRGPTVVFAYDTALNGLALELSAPEAGIVATLDVVSEVIADTTLELVTDAGPDWIGAPAIWDGSAVGTGTQGEGIVAGIIDTGINTDHPSFAEVGGDGYVHTNPKGRFFGLCEPLTGLPFCNDKLIGVWDFTGVGTGPEDDNGHGSHTASTTAGNVVTAALEAPTLTVERPVSGVAPHANIISYKACATTPASGTCLQTGTVASIDQAVADGVDVINFSIGGASRDPYGDGNAIAFLNAQRAGVFLAVSAGNDGPAAATVGSPADAPWVTAVAASTHNRIFINSLVGMAGGGTPPADTVGASVTAGLDSTPIVYAGDYGSALCGEGPANAGTGEAAINPFAPGTFSGEIVVCDRGTYGRVEKAQNVMEGGAGGFVLANDEPSGDSLVADAYPIPGLGISYEDGIVLKAWLASGTGHVAAITGTTTDESASNGDIMASFSSRGPNPYSGDVLKPNVTAPGVDILAAFHTPLGTSGGPEYNVISGTSMSSPHVAGSAALLRALHPDWSPDQVRSALMTTSITDGVLKEDATTPADPFDYGAGRVELSGAAAAGLLFDESADAYAAADPIAGGDLTTLNLPALSDGECTGACAWTRTVTATANGAGTWTASVSAPDGLSLTVEPASFTIGAGESISFRVSADVTGLEAGRWAFATVTLSSGHAPDVHIPVAVLPAEGDAIGVAPVLDDPGETSTTGSYDLTWSDVADAAGYRVQESTNYEVVFSDDAESGLDRSWTTEEFPGGWNESTLRSSSPSTSYAALNTDEKVSTLTLAQPISVPSGADATISFASFEDTEPEFDFGFVDASADGGATWEPILTINGNSGGFVDRAATATGLSGDVLFRFRYVTDPLISAPLYEGWYVDDIQIVLATWSELGETDGDTTTLAVTDQPSGTYYHRVAGLFDTGAAEPVTGPWSNVVDIVVDAPVAQADLRVTDMSAAATDGKPKAGEKVTISATLTNSGNDDAPASETEFELDDGTILGVVKTPAITSGSSVDVSVSWDTRGINGERVITATADVNDAADEADEANNTGDLTVTVRGNKVQNSSFEDPNADGDAPAAWTSEDTAAGTTSWEEGGTDGDRSIAITGTGANAVLAGVPTWTSDAIAVSAGEILTLSARVQVEGASSAPSIGVAYLGPAGNVLSTVAVLSAPLRTDGFELIEESLTVPAGVAEVRVILAGFAPTDIRTRGVVTFDEIGLFSE